MTIKLPSVLLRFRVLFLLVFICANAIVLLLIFRHETVPYPTGWDAPYYIGRIREFVERGIIGQRFGFVLAMGLIHLITRVPILTEAAWASPVLMILTATGVASLVYAAAGRSLLAFALTFVITLWSALNVLLSTGIFDNAFAMVMVFLALWILRWDGPSWRRGITFFVMAGVIGGTHFETFVFFSLITVLYEGLQLYHHRSIQRWWAREYDTLVAICSGGLIGAWHWARTLKTLVSFYTTTAGPNGNASIPYAQSTTWASVSNYLKTGIPDNTALWLVFVAVTVLGYRALRRRDRAADQFLSYVLAGYAILLYAVFRGSIPINRAILIVPINALIGFGIYSLIRLGNRSRTMLSVLVIMVTYLIFSTPTAFVATIRRLSPSISPTTFAAYQSLATYVRGHHIKAYVVIVDIPTSERAASAYYSLWTNWLSATRAVGTTTDQFCIYLGSLANYYHRIPTTRQDRPEYNNTSLAGQKCMDHLTFAYYTTQPTVFVIQGIYSTSYQQPAWNAVTDVVAPNLGLIRFPPPSPRLP